MWLLDSVQGLRAELTKLSVSCARPSVDDVIEPISVNSTHRGGCAKGYTRKPTVGKDRLSLPFKRVGSPQSVSECAPTATPSPRSSLDDDASTAAGAASDVDLDLTPEVSSSRHLSKVAVDQHCDADNFSLHSALESVGRDGLLHKVSHVLQRLAGSQTASSSLVARKLLAHFNCATPPSIGIEEYMQRLMKWMSCTDECVILALIYIDRLEKHHPNIGICRLNIHRILSTALVLAAKFQDDEYRSNAYYAKVAGVSLEEMNQCEEDFLKLLKWNMHVSSEEFEQYVALLFPDVCRKLRH
nr:cyclin U4-1 [Crypthecodinium cohnii]